MNAIVKIALLGIINHFIRGRRWYNPNKKDAKNILLRVFTSKVAAAVYVGIILQSLLAAPLAWLSEVMGRNNMIFTGKYSKEKSFIDKFARKILPVNELYPRWKIKLSGAISVALYSILTMPLVFLFNPSLMVLCVIPIRLFAYGSVNLFYPRIVRKAKKGEKFWDYSLMYAEITNWALIGALVLV